MVPMIALPAIEQPEIAGLEKIIQSVGFEKCVAIECPPAQYLCGRTQTCGHVISIFRGHL